MKAFLLAAGQGARLQPLTLHTPKCLVPVCGKPLLKIWFEILEKYGIQEVLINTHHLADQVSDFVQSLNTPIQAHLTYERKLLGSAGTLLHNRQFVQDEECFWIIYADNLTTTNLANLLSFHEQADSLLTLGLFHTPLPKQSGIVTLDNKGCIIDFVEKPDNPISDLANAGIMLASPKILDEIPVHLPCDLALDVLPNFIERMYGMVLDGSFIDIGTPENYQLAQKSLTN